MAGTLTPTPYQTVLDDDGVAVSGAKINTYDAGTTDRATTYTTSDLSVANANPIIADSAGRYVAYLPAGANLRFIIQTSADVTIDDQDNILSVPGASVNLDLEGTVGEAVTAGQVLYLSSGAEASPLTAGLWYLTDADAAPTSTTAQTIGVAVSAIAINTSGTIRLAGLVTTAGSVVVGTTYYVSEDPPGAITSSAPALSRQVGVAMTTSTLVLAATTVVAASIPNPISQSLLFVDNTYDIGASGATRPRDVFASRNAVVGGTLAVNSTAADAIDVAGGITAGTGNVALVGTDGKISGPLSSTIIDDLSGANLTTLNASNISSGTLANARLPTNVDLGGTLDVAGAVTFNDAALDVNFLVKTDDSSAMLFVDGGEDRIGIGTTTPAGTVHIYSGSAGSISYQGASDDLIVENSTHGGITIATPAASEGSLMFAGPTIGDLGLISYSQASPGLQFHVENAEIARITSTGLGIGTASPSQLLHMQGATTSVMQLIENTSGNGNSGLRLKNDAEHWEVSVRGDNADKFTIGDVTEGAPFFTLAIGTGNADFTGALSKGSGSFKINHPLPSMSAHFLIHSFAESNETLLIHRGTVDLVDGSAQIDLDVATGMSSGTWIALCRDEQVFTSNESAWAAVRGSVTGSTLTIDCEDADCTDTVAWTVFSNRKDDHIMQTDWTDALGYPIIEPLKPEPEEPEP